VRGLDDPRLVAMCGPGALELQRAADEIGLVRAAGHRFDRERFLAGRQTPVFFGSAINNFGVREVLDALVDLAPPPGARDAGTRSVQPGEQAFTGFVFKIQANMDPAHRDRVAFVRVCSGRFRRGMRLRHLRTARDLRFGNVVSFLSQRREMVEDAWPGDVIGLYNRGGIQIGDTLSEGEKLRFTGIPFFAPELFAAVRLRNPIKSKQLQKGLQQLGEEGAIQVFRPLLANETVLGAVGQLQFEVTVYRLRTEYGVDATFETAPYKLARWVSAGSREDLAEFERENASRLARDAGGDLAILLTVPVILEVVQKQWPRIRFHATREHAGLDAS
jgi:peptide chain release factor 3